MKTLLQNGAIVNVFTDSIQKADVLIDGEKIVGVGSYSAADVDRVVDLSGKYICPGFIDGHIHIESTMLTPTELARVCLAHGTTAIVADPHEIANVCGTDGISYMLAASRGLPLHVYFCLPSCVPATPFDEAGAVLTAEDLRPFYADSRVVGLAEMMNYPGVLGGDPEVLAKIEEALARGKKVDGHAPMLSGASLDRYVAAGVESDHECATAEEAKEKIEKGQWVMIRQGTAARNLEALLPLFSSPYDRRCLLVTDDRHPADLLREGHIDHIVRLAVKAGKSVFTAIRMASLQAAQRFGLSHVGAVAPGYRADLLVLEDLETVAIRDVYTAGEKRVANGETLPITVPSVSPSLAKAVFQSFRVAPLTAADFKIEPEGEKCRVIGVMPGELITECLEESVAWDENNGIDTERDLLKLAVIERHKGTGHRGLGFIKGLGMKRGAIASSVSHDSHNLIVVGTNDADMAVAANHVRERGGNVVVLDGKIIAEMSLPVAGLMSEKTAAEVAAENESVREAVRSLGTVEGIEPFMNMAFVSLTVIPKLKMTTQGLVDVIKQERVSLFLSQR
ncbi:MAG: adenine deaminase [Clostridia bacterium]|nr:adenine deaminase [Clostridia bacterium]